MAHAPLARIIAHRGASADAPENTLSAMLLAATHGARCVELDVSISSDGIAYVHHDHKLQRCTNGEGLLCEHSSAQLDKLIASNNMEGFDEEPLPRLSAVVALLTRLQLGLNLEIKPFDGLEQKTVDAILRELQDIWPTSLPLVISSFNHLSLSLLKKCMSEAAIAPLVGNIPDDWQELMQRYDAQNLHCAAAGLTQAKIQQVVNDNYGLYVYTVNNAEEARQLLDWGVSGIFTDHPKALSQQLGI